jgi:hypothetical protein
MIEGRIRDNGDYWNRNCKGRVDYSFLIKQKLLQRKAKVEGNNEEISSNHFPVQNIK